MSLRHFTPLAVLVIAISSSLQVHAANEHHDRRFKSSSPFAVALETLQNQIGYTFKSIGLLRRAMTHSSFSEENNRALSILGANVIEASVSLRLLNQDVEISPNDLNRQVSEISNVELSCSVDGMQLGLHKMVRVAPKTNSTAPAVVCGAFRAIFGAIAMDTGKCDDAGDVFWRVHVGEVGKTLTF